MGKKKVKGTNVHKRSQISIFIIIAIVIVVIISLIFYLMQNKINNTINPEIAPVYSYTENCIKDSGLQSVKVIGLTGGGYNNSRKTDTGILYYLYDGEKNSPTKQDIEEEINTLTGYFTSLCISNLSSFPDYVINIGNMTSNTIVNENNVKLNVDFPVSITKGTKSYSIKNFNNIEIPIRLGYILNATNEIVNENLNHPDSLCLNCLYNISNKYGLIGSVHDFDYDKSLIILTDPQSKIYGNNFAFVFAIKFKNITKGGEII